MLIIYLVFILEIFSSYIQKKKKKNEQMKKRKTLSIKETKSNRMMMFFLSTSILSLNWLKIFSNKNPARQNREQICIVNGNDDGHIEKAEERRNKKKKERNHFWTRLVIFLIMYSHKDFSLHWLELIFFSFFVFSF